MSNVLKQPMQFAVALKTIQKEGDLVYEYNPFRNYRVESIQYIYKNRLYSPKELLIALGKTQIGTTPMEQATEENCIAYINAYSKNGWKALGVPDNETDPTLVEAGELTDFETNELQFDLNHPVNILPQYSYDGSVNLIINDGKNKPRLINSRFSATERNKYQIVDRYGSNDTNIYDQGSQFDLDTSLYKQSIEIPEVSLIDVTSGGVLPVGNYHFYFKYTDADGNETDFVAESGLVSIFIGFTPKSIKSGFRDESSSKLVKLRLSNIDSAYQYVQVYYTRATADLQENSIVKAYKVNQKFLVTNELICNIVLTGYEDTTEISVDELNLTYLLADSVETQDQCQNMLFLANIQGATIPYNNLADLSLRFLPYLQYEEYPLNISQSYSITSQSSGYYDPRFIYNKTGYWNKEIYRFGVVYIMENGSLSPVFNVRGKLNITDNNTWSPHPVYDSTTKERIYIPVEESNYKIISDSSEEQYEEENSKGVCYFNYTGEATGEATGKSPYIYSINFKIDPDVITELKNLKIKGFFFVRQKRIPTILCQAYTIGIDNQSNTPVLPIEKKYVTERFLDDNRTLTHSFQDRLYTFGENNKIRKEAAICPEYDVDFPYLNTIFSGGDLCVTESEWQPSNPYLSQDNRNYYISLLNGAFNSQVSQYNVKIIGVEDNVKLVSIDNQLFSARAGEAEEAFRYEYLERENKVSSASNLIRGSYGPYLGITGHPQSGKLIDIRIPGYLQTSRQDLFKIRYEDKSPFYAISARFDINKINNWFREVEDEKKNKYYRAINNFYRGDCYICQFTHRLNRNFQDPSAPINDKIVDQNCWKNNYEVSDGVVKTENFENINLGDVNAIKLGMWVTLIVRSTKNLNIRATDDSNVDEAALVGHPRIFYPRCPIDGEGSYKIPEALCYNKGFEKSLSERYNFELPEVPAIKNDFSNRIAYSDIHVNDAFKNGFRVFRGSHYRDYPKTYGSITKIVELRGNLLCVFEHGVALIPVNERAVAGEGSGGNVYINTSNVLPENPKVLSDTFGSQWRESVIKTPRAVYGVDTIGKKIWRTNGESFECISDFKVQEFLNQNISLTERELEPIIGIRNVKSHFNRFKNDVMFTFYDNLYGFEEKVWNLCWNEDLQKWITFYSWVPSYSENIYNQFFSFDRNTSKWIAKLGVGNYGNDFSDGITLENNIISRTPRFNTSLHLSNRTIPTGDNIEYKISYTLERDNYGNYKYFRIVDDRLTFVGNYDDITSELYERNEDGSIKKDDNGRRIWLPRKQQKNPDKVVILLNIRANLKIWRNGNTDLEEAYTSGFTNKFATDAGYYSSVVAVIPEYNMQFLTTDFWQHGQAGIIDIADKIYPTYWYGKQHPFEFEFVVADNPDKHKIFDNLQIISNNAEPESFHYEIVGDCYNFAKDKKNMYIRQEATKELYQYNGCDVTYDHEYNNLDSEHRSLLDSNGNEIPGFYDRSTLMPLCYSRQDTINEVEDYYHLKDGSPTKDFSALAGGEIMRYENLDEYRIWNHAKAVDMQTKGRLRGNMQYNEDQWLVQINPINIIYKNEKNWSDINQDIITEYNPDGTVKNSRKLSNKIPIELGQSPIPDQVLEKGDIIYDWDNPTESDIPENSLDRAIVSWGNLETKKEEVKLKDKWIKIRIRYTGNKLAVISAIKTLYAISYS